MARHLAADKFPFSADIDRELAGHEPPVRRSSPEQRRADAPPFEQNPPAHGPGMTRRDGAGGAEQRPARVAADPCNDLLGMLGSEHFRDGKPSAPPGRVCGCGCGKTLPSTGKAGMQYLNPAHRIAASRMRRKAAAEQN